ncbi:MAG: hypothetical protein JJT85_02920 [Chromatiales bacterium]|nr:hypothetical protein [Chromatiales bacterium]
MTANNLSGQPRSRTLSLLAAAGLALSLAACAGDHDHGEHAGHAGHDSHAGHNDHGAHAGHGDHAGHAGHAGHHGHSTEPDELGRRLWGMEHVMPPELYDELRANIPLFARYSNAEIDLAMEQMGPEYSWYISPPELRGDQGVLVLSHGFRERGDMMFRQSIQSYANIFPIAMAPGMAMMMNDNIQLALDDLREAGVRTVVVVPILSTSHNELMRQWEYVLGFRDEPEFATVGQVNTEGLELFIMPALNDDPMVAEMLLDYALDISENPANETIMVLAHGASGKNAAEDNVKELVILNNLARYIVEDGGFSSGFGFLLQDDAPPEIRAQNVERMREKVGEANARGERVLVVTNLIGSRTIQAKMRQDLAGMDYRLNARGLSEHENFTVWIGEMIREGFEKSTMPSAAAAR